MKYLSIWLITLCFSFGNDVSPTVSPSDCKVLVETIADSYEGDCKKGLAHGKGKAVGVDTYDGEFKKGYPEGLGKYTWANGDFYAGDFKKGEIEGAGTKVMAGGAIEQKGYFMDGDYIGTEKKPYKTLTKAVSITRVTYNRIDKEGDFVTFKFTRLGKPVKGQQFRIAGSFGVVENFTDYSQTIKIHEFPFKGGVSFQAMGARDSQGTGGGDWVNCDMEFKLNIKGTWEVTVEIAGTN